ncbi:MAG: MBL fold metallo-hydrolase [Candidatus Woesearchaeota archaeon]
MLKIFSIGGYGEVGKNCTGVLVDDEMVLLDMGINVENYIKVTNDEEIENIPIKKLIDAEAVPDIDILGDFKKKVKAIIISHAHLDHVGGVPYLANRFDCPIHATPYTIEVLKEILADHEKIIKNDMITHSVDSLFSVTKNIKIQFINSTHSTPETVVIVVHTKYGDVVYVNDFKLDHFPILGKPPNIKSLKKLKTKVLIIESLYAAKPIKTPSERVAREMLRDVFTGVNIKGKAIVITTFSSHLARLKTIIEFGKQINRKIVFMGRSLTKYVIAAEKLSIIDFSKNVTMLKYGSDVKRFLKKMKNPEKFLFVVTGHQGEPKAILSRMTKKLFPFKNEDIVVFSSTIIPTETNYLNRANLENELKKKKVRIFSDIHVSGHGAREDLRDLINMIKPGVIIPSHGTIKMQEALRELAIEMNFRPEQIQVVKNGEIIEIK